jgi:hypothetical protein
MDYVNKDKALIRLKIDDMLLNGRKEITTIDQLNKYPCGSLISYMNSDGIFRKGGFLLDIQDNSFSFLTSDFERRYRINMNKVSKIWIGSVYKVKNDVVSIVPTTKQKTSFPVKVGNIIVFYGQDNYAVKRYTHSAKFQTVLKWFNRFGSDKKSESVTI